MHLPHNDFSLDSGFVVQGDSSGDVRYAEVGRAVFNKRVGIKKLKRGLVSQLMKKIGTTRTTAG